MSKYEQNKTMKLLAHQVWIGGEAREQIEDVLEAYRNDSDVISFAIDIFNLGVINRIRKERSKRNGRIENNRAKRSIG